MLIAARQWIANRAEDSSYGFFTGGDPRLFTPDSENAPEEIAAHKAACAAWDRGEQVPEPKPSGRIEEVDFPEMPDGKGGTIPGGKRMAMCCGGSYGPGVQTYRDEEALALVARLDAAIAALGEAAPHG